MNAPQSTAPTIARFIGMLLLGAATLTTSALAQRSSRPAPTLSDLGPNVLVFDPSMPTSQIQSTIDAISAQQVGNEFGTQRYTLLFKPGTYGSAAQPLDIQVGFYTEVAGLGALPTDVTIIGHVDVFNQCGSSGCIALDNFWRSLSNLTINVAGLSGCHGSADFWAVSQAAPMRRVNITGGNLSLMDYCTGPAYASGGFFADSSYGYVIDGSQQQFYVRNGSVGGWSNAIWNQVFTGVIGAPAQSYPNPAYTTLPATPISREKAYLFLDANGNVNVFAPGVRTASVGTTWAAGASAPGRTLPLSAFFIADPSTSVGRINHALDRGQNLILTPGVYQLERPINITRDDTVVLGLGDATLVPQSGREAITIGNVDGVQVDGIIIDAGPQNSDVLFQIGKRDHDETGDDHSGRDPHAEDGARGHQDDSNASDPITLNDVFFRVGGATAGSATTSLQIDRNNVLLDDIWAWRADHGNGVGWTLNTAAHGVVVNSDNVTALGLAVEHYQQEQVLWNGNGGETIFYQSELPYDVPAQSAWMDGAANGYPSYVVSDNVTTHQAFGLGIYSYFNQGVAIIEDNAMTVPTTSGIAIHDVGTVFLNGSGQITHVIDGVGTTASKANDGVLNPVVLYQ